MTAPTYSRSDFQTDQEVRWCPGCGDYTILAAVQSFMANLGVPREKIVFVSGIGCSSRFPYYMNTYGCTRSMVEPLPSPRESLPLVPTSRCGWSPAMATVSLSAGTI